MKILNKFVIGVICAITWLPAKTALADLPPSTQIEEGTENEKTCYDLEGMKALLLLDNLATYCDLEKKKLNLELFNLRNVVDAQAKIINKQDDVIKLLNLNYNSLKDKWEEENKKRHEAENIPQWQSMTPWIIAAVTTVGAAAAITYAVVK